MKKSVISVLFFAILVFSVAGVFAAPCALDISMINQDPYPATPGEEAKVVFQIDGVENTECGTVEFELLDKYPISISPDQKRTHVIEAGTFTKDFKSFYLASYKMIVSNDALDGENPIEIRYRTSGNVGYVTQDFNLEVEDIRANFEVHVKSYDYNSRTLILEILNVAENDVQALSVEIPRQDGIQIKGSNKRIVGDLDSNDYTTAEFEAIPQDGEIEVLIHYSDKINERRVMTEVVDFESDYFVREDESKTSFSTYLWILLVVGLIIWWIVRRRKKKKEFEKKLRSRSK